MNKYYLLSKMKSTGTAYLCWFFLGCHYAYLGKWGLQLLYWVTLGGLGFWCLFDLFHIPTKVNNHNLNISSQIESLKTKETEAAFARNMAMINASKSN
ncbi:TM2 domain-containing protein [Flavobacteriaceae bacterium F08102]|nr:TM2 domain-containing protein [Flavobacteriaceae bacterium F08102]